MAQQLIKPKLPSILMASGQGQQCAQLKIGQYYYEGTEISKNFKKYSSIIRWQQTKGAQKPNAMLKSATMKEQEHFPVQTILINRQLAH